MMAMKSKMAEITKSRLSESSRPEVLTPASADSEETLVMAAPLTQDRIDRNVSWAISHFDRVMPPIDVPYPKITYANARRQKAVREKHEEDTSRGYDTHIRRGPFIDYTHGASGDVIFVHTGFPKNTRNSDFVHRFWRELGRFYVTAARPEKTAGKKAAKQIERNEEYERRGSRFWQEFVAEAIANHVEGKVDAALSPSPARKRTDWKADVWGEIVKQLADYLESALFWSEEGVDEYYLAHYFATLLMNPLYKDFVQAARDGELKLEGKETPEPPETIEPTCISDQEDEYQGPLWKMLEVLEKQVKKKYFWRTDEATVETLGQLIDALESAKADILQRSERG